MIRISPISVVLISLVLMAACGVSYQPGQKVWIDIPGSRITQDGYAVAKVKRVDGDRVFVTVLKLDARANTALARKLRKRVAVVEAERIKDYQRGLAVYRAKKRAYRLLESLVAGRRLGEKKLEAIEQGAGQAGSAELLATLALYRLKQDYLAGKLSAQDRLNNIPTLLDKLESLAKEYRAMNQIRRQLPVSRLLSVYLDRKPMVVKRSALRRRRHEMPGNLFTRYAAVTIIEVRRLLDSVAGGKVPALELVENLDDYLDAERRFVDLVTAEGKLINLPVAELLNIRRKRLARRLRPALRRALIRSIDIGSIRSEQQAGEKFQQIEARAGDLEKRLGIRIFRKGDRERLVLKPVRQNLRWLRINEKYRYRLAVKTDQSLARQRSAIDLYLRKYPEGRYRTQVEQAREKLEERAKKLAEMRRRQEQNLLAALTSKKVYRGEAGYRSKTLKFRLRVSRFDQKSGKFSGRMIWPERKGAINKIKGVFDRKAMRLYITETEAVKKGNWHTGSSYRFRFAGENRLQGTHNYRIFIVRAKKPAVLYLK